MPIVVKVTFIAEERAWREKIVVDALYAADKSAAPAYAPEIVAVFAGHGSPPLDLSQILSMGRKRQANVLTALPDMVRRHVEVMVFASPRETRKLMDVFSSSITKFPAVAKQLFMSILDAFRRGVIHRDVSVNNILFAEDQLLMVDWELGRFFGEPFAAQGTVTGTLDTMSVASLSMTNPLPHDDIESAIYVLLKALTQTFKPPEELRAKWSKTLARYHWDDPLVDPDTLQELRHFLWSKPSYSSTTTLGLTLSIFRSAGREGVAQILESLFSLPLPLEHDVINISSHAAVLSSLTELVEKAVAALESVDLSSLAREI
ncbi:hypothetical protein C8R43DRAFT_1005213 [Mycena crocata]|nr:hypothetical protein C8R43DRAFT_1005213 [Mycena crocata]